MKKKVLHYLAISMIISFVFVSCKKNQETSIEHHNNPENTSISYEVAPWVKYVPLNTLESLSSVSDNGELAYNSKAKELRQLRPGEIIVSPPVENAPYGYVKRVLSVNTQGEKTYLRTEDAPLTDVFISLDLNIDKNLTLSDLDGGSEMKNGNSWEFNRSFDETLYSNNGITVTSNGEITITPSFNFNLKIEERKISYLNMLFNVNENANLTVAIDGQLNYTPDPLALEPFKFHPIVIWAGYVPIVIVPKIEFLLGAEVDVELSTSTNVTQSAEISSGYEFDGSEFMPINNVDKSFDFNPPGIDNSSARVNGYVMPQIDLLLYDFMGPYLNLKGYLELDADIHDNPWWTLYGGLILNAGINASALSDDIEDPVMNLLNYKTVIAQAELINANGIIRGVVKNALTNDFLSGVYIEIKENNITVAHGSTETDGSFEIRVPADLSYDIIFTKNGFLPVTYYNIEVSEDYPTILEPVLQIDTYHSGNGTISGHILNALNGNGVEGIGLKLRNGINNQTGNVVKTTTTGTNGGYTFSNVEAGNYTVETVSSNYGTTFFSVVCIGGQNTLDQDATVTPNMNPGEIRIVLTWGENPSDLDSHLTGPISGSSNRFHVYFSVPSYSYNGIVYDALDHDDVTSYGPETVTIYHQINGVYRYSVHDYSNKNSNSSYALSESNAQVRIYSGGVLTNTFYVPANQEGTLWTVFELNGQTITPINNLSYESSPGSITQPTSIKTDAYLMRNLIEK